jgi:uncharacterized delta-60 repeat protein
MTLFECGKRACLVVLFALSAACGGGGDGGDGSGGNNPPPPPPPGNTGIGSAGGTVTEPSGGKVVIPAGALTTNTAIAIAQTTAASLPPLPAGVTPFGPMYATTPHGTAFAKPVTITIPFDPSKVPAGTTPVLYKTNPAMNGWLTVPGATINGSTMSADVQSFSGEFVGPLLPPPLEKGSPYRNWTVLDERRNREFVQPSRDFGEQTGKELKRSYDFGPTNMVDPGVPLDLLPREFRATGLIFSSPGGGSYGVSNEAPLSTEPTDLAGNFIDFSQSQSYIKNAADAKLTLLVTQARIEAFDDATPNPGPCAKPGPKCTDQKYAQIVYHVKAFSKPSATHPAVRKLFDRVGFMSLAGWRRHWKPQPVTEFDTPLWTEQDVQTDVDVDGNDGRGARLSLKKKLAVPIDISSIDVNEEFTLEIQVDSHVFDGRPAPEFNFLGASFRDPTVIDGNPQVITEGLDPTDAPTKAPVDDPNLPAECHALPAAGTLAFASPSYNVPEGAASGGIDLLVMRTGGSAGEVSATVTTSDGTATAPGDYQSVNTSITFKDGEIAPRFINVPLAYSTADEGDKTFTVTASDVTGCATLGQATSEVTIIDDTRPAPPLQIFTLGGTVSGLAGSGLILRTSGFDQRQIAANGPYTFVIPVADGTAYNISVASQPNNPLQTCTVTNGTGTVDGANVTNIDVNCVTQQGTAGLDDTFGSHGKVFDSVAANQVALQPDGKLLVIGGLALRRYNSDGSPDTGFGDAGHVNIVTNGGGLDAMKSVALQPDGKIVVVGFTSFPTVNNDDWIVLRFNANGSPDLNFGTGGRTLTDFAGMNDQAKSVLIQPDGKIVVSGQAQVGTPLTVDQDFAVVRYLANGTPDPGFGGGDGKSTLNVGGHSDFVNAAALQADGKIVVVGRVFTDNGSGNSDMGIARFFGSGDVDTTFGHQGTQRIDFKEGIVPVNFDGGDWDEALDVLIQGDGKILIGGYIIRPGVFSVALVRLVTSGDIDTQFGMVSSPAIEKAAGIALQADGKIVAAGPAGVDFGIARFTSDGQLDQTFQDDGKLLVDFFGAFDAATDVVIQPDGKIIAAGSARNGSGGGLGIVRVVP